MDPVDARKGGTLRQFDKSTELTNTSDITQSQEAVYSEPYKPNANLPDVVAKVCHTHVCYVLPLYMSIYIYKC